MKIKRFSTRDIFAWFWVAALFTAVCVFFKLNILAFFNSFFVGLGLTKLLLGISFRDINKDIDANYALFAGSPDSGMMFIGFVTGIMTSAIIFAAVAIYFVWGNYKIFKFIKGES